MPKPKGVSERERELMKLMLVTGDPMRAGASHFVFIGEEITGRSTLAHLRDIGMIELEQEGNQATRNQIWVLSKKGRKEAEK